MSTTLDLIRLFLFNCRARLTERRTSDHQPDIVPRVAALFPAASSLNQNTAHPEVIYGNAVYSTARPRT